MGEKLTQDRLKELLSYNRATGTFTWKVSVGSARPGQEAAPATRVHGYRFVHIDGVRYTKHRLAWLYVKGRWPSHQIDHRNRDRSDNRFTNLREATDAQNRQNMRKKRGTVSKLQGVTWFPRDGKWMARIGHNYKSVFLGYFDTEEQAHAAYVEAKKSIHKFQPEAAQ